MSFRSPYLVSSLGHLVVLSLLVSITAFAPRNLTVPGVHIVSIASTGAGGRRSAEPASIVKSAAAQAPAKPAPPAVDRPHEKEKRPPEKGPTRRDPKPAQAAGALRAPETGMVSKSKAPPRTASGAATAPPAAAASQEGGPGTGNDRSAVGVEGENGRDSWYFALLRDRIAEAWRPPPAIGRTGEARVAVHFVLRPTGGQPERLEVQQSSQVPFFDRLALSAVLGAAPYPPFPGDLGAEPIGIKLNFSQQY